MSMKISEIFKDNVKLKPKCLCHRYCANIILLSNLL